MTTQADLAAVGSTRSEASSNAFERSVSLILLATPALLALVTFGASSDFAVFSRRISLLVRVAELLIVFLAIRDGFSIFAAWHRLSRQVRWLSSLWAASVVMAAAFAMREPGIARALATGTLLHGLLALALYDRLRDRPAASITMLLRAWALGLAGYAIAAVYCMILVFDRVDFPWDRFGAGVTNLRQIGFFGIPAVGIALGLLASANSRAERNLPVLALFAGLFLVIWCGGRASVFGAGGAFVLVLLLARGKRLLLTIATAGCVVVAMPIAHILSPTPTYGPVSLFRLVQPSGSADGYSSGRLSVWEWTLEDILARPFPGHGEGQFAFMISERIGHVYNHPHNFILQAMYEWGIPGFLALAALICVTFWQARKLRGAALAQALPALAGFTGLATTSLLDGALYYPVPVISAILFLVVITLRSQEGRLRHGNATAHREA